MTPEALAQIVAAAVNTAVSAALAESAPVSADVAVKAASAPAKRTNRRTNRGSSKGTSGPKASAARGKKARKPFKPNEDWKGQEPNGRMPNTVARLYADGHITKAEYNAAKLDKYVCAVTIGKGFAKAGIGR